MSGIESTANRKGSCWKSLLSVLLAIGAEAEDVYLAEVAPGNEWDYAFWNYGPEGAMVAYRRPTGTSLWRPVETPAYTGRAKPWKLAADGHCNT